MDSGYSDAPSPGSSSTSSRAVPSPLSCSGDEITSNSLRYLKLSDQYATPDLIQYDSYSHSHSHHTVNPVIQMNFQNSLKKPELIIVEQPVDKFRFRYKSEMHGTHGSLMGERNEKSKRTYPAVELRNYNGKALIRCTLYQNDALKRLPHSHKLVVRNGDEDLCDPHELTVSPEEGFRAVFQGMGIIHTAKKDIVSELISKKIKVKKFELGRDLTQREIAQIKINADKEAKDMNLNQVCLAFHAYAIQNDGGLLKLLKLCEPVFSRPINNMKSALTGELKIARMSAVVSNAAGGEDLFLLVEKVGKKNIKVRFYEVDQHDDEIWEDWGIFCEADVHHQYAIALRTPQYKDKNIEKDVEVFIQLERPSDGARSEPLPFKYKPSDFVISRKRAKRSSSSSSGLSSLELPETILNQNDFVRQQQQQQQYNTLTLSEEFNKNELLNDLTNCSRQNSGSSSVPDEFLKDCIMDSNELYKLMGSDFLSDSQLKTDGVDNLRSESISIRHRQEQLLKINEGRNTLKFKLQQQQQQQEQQKQQNENIDLGWYIIYFRRIVDILRMYGKTDIERVRREVEEIFREASQTEDLLQCSIREGNVNIVPKLLKWIKNIKIPNVLNYQNDDKQTCLHIACLFDRPEYISALIQLGVNPNLPDKNGNTPLHIAVENNMMMCAAKIIEKSNYINSNYKLNINCENYDGLTPLHLAISKGNLTLVRKLIEDGKASVKLPVSKNGYNPLHLAIQQKDEQIVKYLIESTSVNLNEQNLSGDTPLKLANAMNLKSIVDLLIKHGGKIGNESSNSSNYDSFSPPSSLSSLSPMTSTESTLMDFDDNKSIKEDSCSSDDEDNDGQLQIDETCNNNDNITFDDICINELSSIFNMNDNWKLLAEQLELDPYTCLWSSADNPTKIMLEHICRYEVGKLKIKHIIDACKELGANEAIISIQEMIKRQ